MATIVLSVLRRKNYILMVKTRYRRWKVSANSTCVTCQHQGNAHVTRNNKRVFLIHCSPVNLGAWTLGISSTQARIERKSVGLLQGDTFVVSAVNKAAFAAEPLVQKVTRLHQGSVGPSVHERGSALWFS